MINTACPSSSSSTATDVSSQRESYSGLDFFWIPRFWRRVIFRIAPSDFTTSAIFSVRRSNYHYINRSLSRGVFITREDFIEYTSPHETVRKFFDQHIPTHTKETCRIGSIWKTSYITARQKWMRVSQISHFRIDIYFVFVSVILIKASFYLFYVFFKSSFRNVHSLYFSLSLSLSLDQFRCQFSTIWSPCCYINVTSFEIAYLWCVHKQCFIF